MIVVSDTSPITALIHLQKRYLIHMLYGQVYIPSVTLELNTLISFGYDISFLKENDKYIICKAKDEVLIKNLSEHLDEGEAEAIALAKELHAVYC